jgi:hypothetical protein
MPYFRAFLSIQRRNFKKAEFTTPLPEAVQTSQNAVGFAVRCNCFGVSTPKL